MGGREDVLRKEMGVDWEDDGFDFWEYYGKGLKNLGIESLSPLRGPVHNTSLSQSLITLKGGQAIMHFLCEFFLKCPSAICRG